MVALLNEKNIGKLIELLQTNHSCSLTISTSQFNQIKDTKQTYTNRKPILLPPEKEENNSLVLMLELEAEALQLELTLLAA